MIKVSTHNQKIIDTIYAHGGFPYFVGGCVRDHLMNIEPKDIDIEVYGISIDQLVECLKPFGADLVGKSFGVIKVDDLDISIPRTDEHTGGNGHKNFNVTTDHSMSFEDACSRRDFTINAILMDCKTGAIVDPFDGQKDIEKKIIRHINDEHFVEDPLRVYRAVQFSSRFGFAIDASTIKLCKKIDLSNIADERVFEEMKKMIEKSKSFRFAKFYTERLNLHKFGILDFNVMERAVNKPFKNRFWGMLACSFLEHYHHANDHAGFLKENKLIEYINMMQWGYDHFFDFDDVIKMRKISVQIDIMELALIMDSLEPTINLQKKVEKFYEVDKDFDYSPVINGNDLIEMGFKQGPIIGKLLHDLYNLQLEGHIKTLEEAKNFVR